MNPIGTSYMDPTQATCAAFAEVLAPGSPVLTHGSITQTRVRVSLPGAAPFKEETKHLNKEGDSRLRITRAREEHGGN